MRNRSGFRNRSEAGQALAQALTKYRGRADVVVLGLARGGVPVAAEVAAALAVPLGVMIVRKVGMPGNEEYAIGAVGPDESVWLDRDVIDRLGIPQWAIQEVVTQEIAELRRRAADYPATDLNLAAMTVILVDDGLATGASMRAAVVAARNRNAAAVVVAVPVAAASSVPIFSRDADEFVSVLQPTNFGGVGNWYSDFSPTTDREIHECLRKADQRAPKSLVPSSLPGLSALEGEPNDYDEIMDRIGDARIVLLGEASHGTHEFYRERSRLTQRLVDEKGFTAIALEADWPDTYRLSRYVLGRSVDRSAQQALSDFQRFPTWMWRNQDVVLFAEWLRARNDAQSAQETKASFYGLDLYSMQQSMAAVLSYLEDVDPVAAADARERYSCFDHVGGEGQEYGRSVALSLNIPCEDQVVAQLKAIRQLSADVIASDGWEVEDKHFYAEQNARLVLNAERYYREMYRGRVSSWNLRDLHMAETLDELIKHLDAHFGNTKVVVWAHNSHVGDARATAMGQSGELNIGQLIRSRWPNGSFSIGFTTYDGTVTAAPDWGAPHQRMTVRPAVSSGYESLFHELPARDFVIDLREAEWIPAVGDERAIGVIYRPETERASHWFQARLRDQFDAIVHIDRTNAVVPLDRTELWDSFEAPQTYPSGL